MSPRSLLCIPVFLLPVTAAVVGCTTDVALAPDRPGEIAVMVQPEAHVFVDGVDRGQHALLNVDGLAPGEHQVRLQADGFTPWDGAVTVEPGKIAKVQQVLQAAQAEVVADEPETDEAVPTVGVPAQPEPSVGVISAAPKKPAPKKAAPVGEPGFLNVGVVGGGWGKVSIDGTPIDKTAPLNRYPLPPGKHTIKVDNPEIGLHYEKVVEVVAGEAVRIHAKPD